MKLQIVKGSTSQIVTVFIQDNTQTDGRGLGSLDQTSSIVGGYVRAGGTGVALAVDENVTTEGTYQAPSTAGQVRIGTPANMTTGTYELHFHNDLFAAGADSVFITLGGAASMAVLPIEIQLTDFNLNSATVTLATATQNSIDAIEVDTGTTLPAKLLAYVQLLARKDYAISQDNSTEVTEINADGGSGAGTFLNTTDAQEAIRDRGDLAWLTGGGGGTTKSYTTTNWTRTVGDNDGGAGSDTLTVNGAYFATGEINSTTLLEVDAVFTATVTETAQTIDVWCFYAGGGSHRIIVQAYDTTGSAWEPIGSIGLGTIVEKHTFNLSPSHTNSATGVVLIKFIHSSGTGITSHVLNIDKAQINISVPVTSTEKMLAYIQLLARSDAAITTDRATELGEINTDQGSGAGDYAATTDSQEAIRDTEPLGTAMRGTDSAALASAWTATRAGYVDKLSVSGTLAHSDAAATYKADVSALALEATLTAIKGATWNASTDTLEAIRDRGDSAWVTATTVTVSDKTGFSLASTGLDLVTAWTVGITGTVSGNSTFNAASDKVYLANGAHGGAAASLVLADYSNFKATGFSTLDAAGVRTAVGLASANLDTQLADLPTVAEFEARTIVSADYFVVGDYTAPLDAAGVRTAVGLASANLDTQLSALSGYVDCLPATLDGSTFTSLPEVTTDAASRTASKADVSLLALEATAQSILADTNELQTDWANGGRLDLLLDVAGTPITISTEGINLSSS